MKNISVLIADDTIFMRATLQKMLSNYGVSSFIEAANGKEAVRKYKTERPDLVIMDISMPIMDGIEATRQIKSIDPGAKILICSQQGQKNNVMEGIKAGASSFLVKPVKEEKLINEINVIFEKTPAKP
ncbi:MAG TPA: response regulator [Bacillota bacterium]|nr:response regulator [Bacillota bacterium]HOR86376.1 response regulator [Bacillota bacterium]HPL54068.1 response regulator [Bacillota bacterium]